MEIAEALQGKGYPAEPLNGDMPQSCVKRPLID